MQKQSIKPSAGVIPRQTSYKKSAISDRDIPEQAKWHCNVPRHQPAGRTRAEGEATENVIVALFIIRIDL